MTGNLSMMDHSLGFYVPGKYGFFIRNPEGTGLEITNHDGLVLLKLTYNGTPTIIGGHPIATATKPAVYDLPLAAGMSANIVAKYHKNQFGEVSIYGGIAVTYTAYPTLIATLPVGFRPTTACNFPALLTYGNSTAAGSIQIDPDGSIWLHSPISGITGTAFNATFVVA